MTSVTSAIPCAARFSDPAQMTSSALRERSARPCSPSAQRSASARLLLPDPLGPTTALIPRPNSIVVRSANDLKPCSRSARRRGSASGGGSSEPSSPSPLMAPTRRARRSRAGCSIACDAAAVSAVRRDGPWPVPSNCPSTQTSIRNDFSWSGPVASSSRYDGRSPECRWVYSCSRLFGLLSDPIGSSALSSGSASPISQSRTLREPEVEVERAGDGLERRGEQ